MKVRQWSCRKTSFEIMPGAFNENTSAELTIHDAEADSHAPEHVRTVAAIRFGIEDAKAGRVRPAREALRELQQRLGLQIESPIQG